MNPPALISLITPTMPRNHSAGGEDESCRENTLSDV